MTDSTNPTGNSGEQKTNLAPSALFVKENILDKFYPILRDQGLVMEANQIIIGEGDGNDTKTIEFRIKCRALAQKEIEQVESENTDPEIKRKKKNALNNFSSGLVANVKPEASTEQQTA